MTTINITIDDENLKKIDEYNLYYRLENRSAVVRMCLSEYFRMKEKSKDSFLYRK